MQATFRHDTSRNLDPRLHTHAVVANMVQGGDSKRRTMLDDGLFHGKMAIGAIDRAELARGLGELGCGIGKTRADGRFEIEVVPRAVIDALSTLRAEIEAAMSERGMGESRDTPHLAAMAALLTRAAQRDIDRDAPERGWKRQAKAPGFPAANVPANARETERGILGPDLFAGLQERLAPAAIGRGLSPAALRAEAPGGTLCGSPAAAIWARIEFAIRNALRRADMAALQLTHAIGSRHSVKGVEYAVTAFDRDRGPVVMEDEDGWELHIGAATDAAARF